MSELLLCTKGNTTRIIKGLEQDGYLSREVDKEDNRAQRLALTENGQKLLDTASAAYLSYRQTLFACLSNEQKKSLIENLKVLNADCISQLRPNQSP